MVLLPMLEEFDRELARIGGLVQEMEEKDPRFPEDCNEFLLLLENLTRRYSLPAASQLSVLRGELLCKNAPKKGEDRKESLRLRDEQLMSSLSQARQVIDDYFAPWRRTFDECAGLCRQMAAGAALKGLISRPPSAPDALDEAWNSLFSDQELAPVLAHVVGLAGLFNARILLDQSLSHADISAHP